MALRRMTYQRALDNAEHLIALDVTTIHIEADGAPWSKADHVEVGGGYRLNGPTGVYVIAYDAGLTFKWSVEFEHRDANGRGVSLFDRDRLRDVALRLQPKARASFAELLEEKVLPELAKRTNEIREALREQADSEDCVRGIIAYAKSADAP